jgi:hypothetical protein
LNYWSNSVKFIFQFLLTNSCAVLLTGELCQLWHVLAIMTQKILVDLTDKHKQLIGSTAVVFFLSAVTAFSKQCFIRNKKQICYKEQKNTTYSS